VAGERAAEGERDRAGDLQRLDRETLLCLPSGDRDRRRDRRRLRVAAGQGNGCASRRGGGGELHDPECLVVFVGATEDVGVAAQKGSAPCEDVDPETLDLRRGAGDGEAPHS
jgi:hypothetical protein